MFYSEYRGRCTGRIMCFLFKASSLFDSQIFFGKFDSYSGIGKLHYGGGFKNEKGEWEESPLFATYQWIGDTDIPLFDVQPRYKPIYEMPLAMAVVAVIEHDLKFGKGMWSESQKMRDDAEKEKQFRERLRQQIMESKS